MRDSCLFLGLRRAAPGLLLFGALGLCETSSAQSDEGVTLDPFRAAELATDGFALARPVTLLPGTYSARLTLDYGRNSLSFDGAGSANDYVAVRNHLVGTIGIAFAAHERVTVGVGLPLNAVMEGERPPLAGVGLAEADGLLAGDPYLTGRVRLLGAPGDTFVLGAQLRLTLPIADAAVSSQRFAGEQTATLTPSALVELTFDDLRINGSLGGRFRGVQEQRDLTVGQELVYAIGATYTLVDDRLALVGEAYGSTDFGVLAGNANSPLEVIVGVQAHPNSDWHLGAAIGSRLTSGYGASDMRAVLSVGYAPTVLPVAEPEAPAAPVETDTDGDGVLDAADAAPDEPEDADGFEDADGRPDPDNDGDGVLDAADAAPNEPEDVDGFEDADGRPDTDNDADGVADADDHCPMTPGQANASTPECSGCPASACIDASGSIRILDRIEFENGRDVLRASSQPVLESVRAILATTASIHHLRIEGHTDDRGNDARNLELSARRAAAVRTWLVEHGIEGSRLESVGLGETRPIADNRAADGRAQNRRVEFHIVD